MLGINADSYNVVVWLTSQFSRRVKSWWLNCKQKDAIPESFDTLVEEIRKTSMLLNIRHDANNAMFGLTQGNMSYAAYAKLFNDSLRRSRQHLRNDLQCVRFISGLPNFQLQTHAKSHRSQEKGCILPFVELQHSLDDLVTNSPHLGRVRPAATQSTTHGGGQLTRKRPNDDPLVEASKRWQRGEGSGLGRGRDRGNGRRGRGRTSPNTSRNEFNAIARALTPRDRKRHQEEGLCFKSHKKGHRLFKYPELKGKESVGAPSKQK
jgi:hypothetical protein